MIVPRRVVVGLLLLGLTASAAGPAVAGPAGTRMVRTDLAAAAPAGTVPPARPGTVLDAPVWSGTVPNAMAWSGPVPDATVRARTEWGAPAPFDTDPGAPTQPRDLVGAPTRPAAAPAPLAQPRMEPDAPARSYAEPGVPDGPIAAADDPGPGAPGPAPGVRQRQECVPPATGRTSSGTGRGGPLAALHRLADGTGQRIAVIDTGVSPHPSLEGRLTGGGDYVAGGDGLADCDGHGTEVAGLLAAAPDAGTRTGGGIAPAAQIVSLRQSSARFTITGPDGRDRPAGEIGTLAAAIDRAVTLGATVVNISEVVCVPADRAVDAGAALQRAVRRATGAGVVVVAAAGNVDASGTCTGDPGLRPMPALFDDVIAVGAVDGTDRPAGFSVPGDWVDVAAPGVDVRPSATGGGTALLSGTSYATPVVAGVAALLRERFPSLTPDQIADRIRATARHPARGRDDHVGYGVIDPAAALTAEPLLLRPSPDPAGGAVTGPRTGAGAGESARDGTSPLPGLGARPTDRTPAVLSGLLAALLLGVATATALRRLRSAPGPGSTSPPVSARVPADPPGRGRVPADPPGRGRVPADPPDRGRGPADLPDRGRGSADPRDRVRGPATGRQTAGPPVPPPRTADGTAAGQPAAAPPTRQATRSAAGFGARTGARSDERTGDRAGTVTGGVGRAGGARGRAGDRAGEGPTAPVGRRFAPTAQPATRTAAAAQPAPRANTGRGAGARR